MGEKFFELKDHLGNVRVVVSDRKNLNTQTDELSANVVAYNNYYPFGMPQPGRNFDSQEYRYGFNGKEKDDELIGNGLNIDFGARLLDTRISRWKSVDKFSKQMPSWSPYNFAFTSPIKFIDSDGNVPFDDYIIYANGTMLRIITEDETDSFSYVGLDGGKTLLGVYEKNASNLINLPQSFRNEKLSIGFKTKTENLYIKPSALAAVFGSLAETKIQDLTITNASRDDGSSPKPSRSHKNGVGIDFRYLRKDKSGNPVLIYDNAFDIDRQNDLNGALNKFGFDYQLSEHFASPMLDEYEGRNISVDAAQEILDSGLSSHKLDKTKHYDGSDTITIYMWAVLAVEQARRGSIQRLLKGKKKRP